MIYVLMQRHGEPDLLHDGWYKMCKEGMVSDDFLPACYDDLHPEDQVREVKQLIKYKDRQVLMVNSLIVIYALNNELIRNPKLQIKAFEVLKSGRLKSAMSYDNGQPFINKAILGHIVEKLSMEYNRLCAKKFKAKQ
jgi:hypothetical protein